MAVRGSFEVQGWDEKEYENRDGGRKLTEAIVDQKFEGGLDGTGQARWLMSYSADGTATFVGLQRVDGAVEGHTGSVVLETRGVFDGKVARWSATVIEGSGTNGLEALTGSGSFEAPMGSTATFDLDVKLS